MKFKNFLVLTFLFILILISGCKKSGEIQLLKIIENGKIGYMDQTGKIIVKPSQYDEIKELSDGMIAVSKNFLWGYLNREGKKIIDYKYYKAFPFVDGFAVVQTTDKNNFIHLHFIDKTGKVLYSPDGAWECGDYSSGLVPVKYEKGWKYLDKTGKVVFERNENISVEFKDGLYRFKMGDKNAVFFNKKGDVILTNYFEGRGEFYENLASFTLYGKKGFVSKDGFVLVQPVHKDVKRYSDGLAAFKDNDNKWGYLNTNGETAIKPVFDEALNFEDKKAIAKIGTKYVIINKDGKTEKELSEYKWVKDFSEGLAAASIDGIKRSYIDKNGITVIEKDFEEIKEFAMGLAAVKTVNGAWGYINKNGEMVIKDQFKNANSFKEGLALVQTQNGMSGFIDIQGSLAIEDKYSYIHDFKDGKAIVPETPTSERFAIDKTGKKIENYIPYVDDKDTDILQSIGSFSEGLVSVSKYVVNQTNNKTYLKYGFADVSGKIVIPLIFDIVKDFKEGLAVVGSEGNDPFYPDQKFERNYTYIDKTGKRATTYSFKDAFDFSDGTAKITKGKVEFYEKTGKFEPLPKYFGKFGFIDRNFKITVEEKYDEAKDFSEGLAPFKLDDKWGFIDKNGIIVIDNKFINAEGFAKVNIKDEYCEYIDKKGKIIKPKN